MAWKSVRIIFFDIVVMERVTAAVLEPTYCSLVFSITTWNHHHKMATNRVMYLSSVLRFGCCKNVKVDAARIRQFEIPYSCLSNQRSWATSNWRHTRSVSTFIGTIGVGIFQSSLFSKTLQFSHIQRELHCITYLYKNSLGNSIFLERETILCCWELIIAGDS